MWFCTGNEASFLCRELFAYRCFWSFFTPYWSNLKASTCNINNKVTIDGFYEFISNTKLVFLTRVTDFDYSNINMNSWKISNHANKAFIIGLHI